MKEVIVDKSFGKYVEYRLEETQVIELLIDSCECDMGNLKYFHHLTNVPRKKAISINKYFVCKETLRECFGLVPNQKPGDIDILIIPADDDRIYFEYSCAFEVKIVRPSNSNFRKNSNSIGSKQTIGLLEDGFPLVGLIHVCMNEPVNDTQLQLLPLAVDMDISKIDKIISYDPFPIFSVNVQYERILKTDLPKYVALNVFGLSFKKDGSKMIHESTDFWHYNFGYFNPKVKSETIEGIKKYFELSKTKFEVIANKENKR